MSKKTVAFLIIIILVGLIIFVESRKTGSSDLPEQTGTPENTPANGTIPTNADDITGDIESRISAGATGNEVPASAPNASQ